MNEDSAQDLHARGNALQDQIDSMLDTLDRQARTSSGAPAVAQLRLRGESVDRLVRVETDSTGSVLSMRHLTPGNCVPPVDAGLPCTVGRRRGTRRRRFPEPRAFATSTEPRTETAPATRPRTFRTTRTTTTVADRFSRIPDGSGGVWVDPDHLRDPAPRLDELAERSRRPCGPAYVIASEGSCWGGDGTGIAFAGSYLGCRGRRGEHRLRGGGDGADRTGLRATADAFEARPDIQCPLRRDPLMGIEVPGGLRWLSGPSSDPTGPMRTEPRCCALHTLIQGSLSLGGVTTRAARYPVPSADRGRCGIAIADRWARIGPEGLSRRCIALCRALSESLEGAYEDVRIAKLTIIAALVRWRSSWRRSLPQRS